jgi:tricorn protease
VRARLPRVLGKTGQVAWVTDAEGADAIEITAADGPANQTPPRRLAAGAIGWVADMAPAPDGSTLAVAARDGRLLFVNVASGGVTDVTSSGNGEVTGLAWSPDSAWLAWSHPGSVPLRRLRMVRVADPGTVVDVTDGRFTDSDPAFTADGKYLAFLSVRSFDPVYDAQVFDLSFPYGCRPYLVSLAAATPSPFAPLPGGRPVGRHDDGPGRDGEHEARPAPVTVDAEGLAGRVAQIPVAESRYSSLRAVQGGLAWLRVPVTGNLGEGGPRLGDDAPRPSLEHFDLYAQRCAGAVRPLSSHVLGHGAGARRGLPLGSQHARDPHRRLVAPPLRRLLARARCRS